MFLDAKHSLGLFGRPEVKIAADSCYGHSGRDALRSFSQLSREASRSFQGSGWARLEPRSLATLGMAKMHRLSVGRAAGAGTRMERAGLRQ